MDGGVDISNTEARAIAQHLLDVTGAAYAARNFSDFAPHYVVPGDVHSFGVVRLVADFTDLHEMFTTVLAYFDTIGLTALERHCTAAEEVEPGVIVARHTTRMMRGTELIAEPFPGTSTLRLEDGAWKLGFSHYENTESGEASRVAARFTGEGGTSEEPR